MSNMATIVRGLSRLSSINPFGRTISSSAVLNIKEGPNIDAKTHTGQKWALDDFRRARFVDKDKQVNPNFAIELIAKDPVVVCDKHVVSSNSGGALGHPKVYINLDKPEVAICGYSGRKFIHKKYYDAKKHGLSITYKQYVEETRATQS